jgi:hypothetical protein
MSELLLWWWWWLWFPITGAAAVQPGPAAPSRVAYRLYPPVAFVIAVWFASLAVLAGFGVSNVDIQAGQGVARSLVLGAAPVVFTASPVIL